MKKSLIAFLLIYPILVFAQDKKAVLKNTIEEINIELARHYVESHNGVFDEGIDSYSQLNSYLERMYSSKNHKLRKAVENLKHLGKTYESGDPQEYIQGGIEQYVKFDFNKDEIDEIINRKIISRGFQENITDESVSQVDEAQKSIGDISNTITDLDNKRKFLLSENDSLKEEIEGLNLQIIKLQANLDDQDQGIPSYIYWMFGIVLAFIAGLYFPYIIKFVKGIWQRSKPSGTKQNASKPNRQTKKKNTVMVKKDTNLPVGKSPVKSVSAHIGNREWLVVHASESGKSHRVSQPPIPCQDNHAVLSLESGWGIAVSCDGAGSAKLSHEGSKFVSEEAVALFKEIVKENKWIENQELPMKEVWEMLASKALKKLRYDLEQYAKYNNHQASELACTIIVVIYAPNGILTTHIGDGRAGFRDENGRWKAIISPHKGEEANQTIFITSNPWLSGDFMMSGVNVPESNVISDIPTAFTLMSDGCESHSFELGFFDKEKQVFIEQNNPYPKFFEPLIKTILDMKQHGLTKQEMLKKWSSFIQNGTEKLEHESDDKTLILGVITD